jgi:acyl-coenzyme A synthetase/AMP-(fatty) acid ligase
MGSWTQFSVYGPLINRNTTIIFEGKPIMTPDAEHSGELFQNIKYL